MIVLNINIKFYKSILYGDVRLLLTRLEIISVNLFFYASFTNIFKSFIIILRLLFYLLKHFNFYGLYDFYNLLHISYCPINMNVFFLIEKHEYITIKVSKD